VSAVATIGWGLPWSGSGDSRRFRRTLAVALAIVWVFVIVIPWLTVPAPLRPVFKETPPPLAHIVLPKPEIVIPPPPPPKQEPLPQPEMKQVKPPEPKKPQPVLDKQPIVKQPTVADAREKAAVSGLLQFKDSFADMRDAVDVGKLNDTGSIRRGTGDAATLDRSLLTSSHGTRSAGVNLGSLSRNTGGVALAGRETTKVDAPPGTVGQGGTHALSPNHAKELDARERSIEDIRRVFDANKGAIFAIYNRALRQDPSLQGKVVLELQIDPTGHVLDCRVVSSELPDQGLMDKIVSRIRMFDFGKKDVGTTTISYPVQFLPT
jgi:outer membrane biosynthesis protein TonB